MALLRVVHFVSPEYEDAWKDLRRVERDDGPGVTGTLNDDEKDNLRAWLAENTIPHKANNLALVSYLGGKLMGENGVYCEIITYKSRSDVPDKVKHDGPWASGAYQRVVRVLATPSSKPLPGELLEALVSRGYAEAGENNRCVEELVRGFR